MGAAPMLECGMEGEDRGRSRSKRKWKRNDYRIGSENTRKYVVMAHHNLKRRCEIQTFALSSVSASFRVRRRLLLCAASSHEETMASLDRVVDLFPPSMRPSLGQ